MEKGILRLVDANANRAREGLRVAEDVARLVLCDETVALGLKRLRHRLTELCASLADESDQIGERASEEDLGRSAGFDGDAGASQDLLAMVRRNMRRSEEACRVLEEISGLSNGSLKGLFKELRYSMYDLEKALAERL
jgi:thiamine-phosphate pyrophosphorylase